MRTLARTGRIDPQRIAAARLVFLDLIDYLQREEGDARRGVAPQEAAFNAQMDQLLREAAAPKAATLGETPGEKMETKLNPYEAFLRDLACHDKRKARARGPTPNAMEREQAMALFAYQSAKHERLILEAVVNGLDGIMRALADESRSRGIG